jgi:predicted RNase H-like nuclease
MGTAKQTIFVGFDSAWADKLDGPGAICSIDHSDDRFSDFSPPEMVGFSAALTYIKRLQRSDAVTLIALDQPTIVPNRTGMRLVEKTVASLISWLGGGVQPANRGKTMFFGDEAPIWRFLEKLEAIEDPEAARVAAQVEYLIEVFPALALASYSPAFFGYRKGPRYNPDRKTFRIEDWIATIDAAINEATRFSCLQLVAWLNALRKNLAPRKVDQDRLDSALCLLIAMRWRLAPREMSVAVGDLISGYIVAPVSATVMQRLTQAALERGVPINALSRPAAAFQHSY